MSRKRGRHQVEAIGFLGLVALVRGLPRGAALAVAGALGLFAFDVVRLRRGVAVENVQARLAPPGGRREAVRIARRSYRVIARTFVDLLRGGRMSASELRTYVPTEELRPVREAAAARGALLISGHFGNWELIVQALAATGVTVGALAKDQHNARVNDRVKEIRRAAGIRPLSSRRGLREAIRLLRDGGCVASLMDQDAGRRGEFVEFLGTPASTPRGLVSLAIRSQVPIVPGVLVDEGGRYRVVLGEVWRPPPAGPDDAAAVRAGVEHVTRFLEARVREHPDNYFWAHRRWKTRPPAEGTAP